MGVPSLSEAQFSNYNNRESINIVDCKQKTSISLLALKERYRKKEIISDSFLRKFCISRCNVRSIFMSSRAYYHGK